MSSNSSRGGASPTVVEQAHRMMLSAADDFAMRIDEARRERHHLTEDGFRARIAASAEEPSAAVVRAVSEVQKRAEEAAANVGALRRGISVPRDSVAEMRAGRYWDRTQRLLDQTDSAHLVATAQKLLRTAEPDELAVLCEEAGPYFESRSAPVDWFEGALAEAVPEYQEARTQLTRAQQARTLVEYNAKMLRKGFAEGRMPAALADPRGYDPDL